MKTTRFLTIPIVGFILLLSLAIPALAAPDAPPVYPSSFYGEIHFISGDGGPTTSDYVEAYVPGITGYAARATITTDPGGNLVYAINVPGDDPETTGIVEGGLQNGTVTFKIGPRVVATGIWMMGTNVNLDIHPPKANAGGPYAGVVGDTLTFSGSATDWLNTETYTYAWDLDDDGAYDDSTDQNPSFSFATTGTKTIKLQVTDSRGGIGTNSATVTIAPKPITVTANGGQTKVYGAADPTFTYTSSDASVLFTGALSPLAVRMWAPMRSPLVR